MADKFEFDPAPVDRAIARLNKILEQANSDSRRVDQLQHVTRPGDAPETQKFHGKLVTSMSRLKHQHVEFVRTIEAQIQKLQQVKAQYAKTDHAAAATMGRFQ